MEQDLTSGSVFRNVIYFSLPYFLSYSGFDWEPGDAYVDGDDRGACDGGYGFNRAVYWSGR